MSRQKGTLPHSTLLHLVMEQEQLSDCCEHKSDMEGALKNNQLKGAMKIRPRIIPPGAVYELLLYTQMGPWVSQQIPK